MKHIYFPGNSSGIINMSILTFYQWDIEEGRETRYIMLGICVSDSVFVLEITISVEVSLNTLSNKTHDFSDI